MAGFDNKYTTATTVAFQHRVEMALTRHAHFTFGDTPTQPETNLARSILADRTNWALKFAFSVASEPSLAVKIDADPLGATVTDAEIESAIQTVFPNYV